MGRRPPKLYAGICATVDKAVARQNWRQRLQTLDLDYLSKSDTDIFRLLLTLPEYHVATRIFSYYSVGREVNTRAFLNKAQSDGKEVYLPVVLGEGKMVFARFAAGETLQRGQMRIPEPGPNAPRDYPGETDLLIIPGLCFDRQGFRLGQGGGYYDRFLGQHPSCCTVGLCREAMLTECVPREEHDRSISILVTEARVIRFPASK